MVDVSKPIENPELKNLLIESMNAKSQEDKSKILELVFRFIALDAKFLSVVEFSKEPEKTENGIVKLKVGTEIGFPTVKDSEGRKFLPIYTDWEELRKNKEIVEKPNTLVLNFDNYASMILDQGEDEGFVINPFSEHRIALSRKQIEHMRNVKNESMKK